LDLEKLSVAELDKLKTEAVQKANEYLATAREINAVQVSKIGDERAAEEAERIIASSSPEVREKIVNALVKGQTAKANGEGKAGGV
jgi:hypothetical protein